MRRGHEHFQHPFGEARLEHHASAPHTHVLTARVKVVNAHGDCRQKECNSGLASVGIPKWRGGGERLQAARECWGSPGMSHPSTHVQDNHLTGVDMLSWLWTQANRRGQAILAGEPSFLPSPQWICLFPCHPDPNELGRKTCEAST